MTLPLASDPAFLNQRRTAISRSPTQIGIDYVNVRPQPASRWRLALHFIPADSQIGSKTVRPEPPISASQVTISGVSPLIATAVQVVGVEYPPEDQEIVYVTVSVAPGAGVAQALPRYRLTIDGVSNLDPFFNSVLFSLSMVVVDEFGPQSPASPALPAAPPPIDYLSKDYASFRQLMLDRLAVLIPDWSESSPADIGITLAEVLAYAADQLSYYQDAVATEAYLETARQRVSMRRHARLLDYAMHEGCNARVWVTFDVEQETALEGGTPLLTSANLDRAPTLLTPAQYQQAVDDGAAVFETLYTVRLHPSQDVLYFYTWGAPGTQIPAGATSTTLLADERYVPDWRGEPDLHPGDVLIFEETSGAAGAAPDPTHRHAIRLTTVEPAEDPLGGSLAGDQSAAAATPVKLLSIGWDVADALPFAFNIAATTQSPAATSPANSVARGNVVLADHGRHITNETLPTVPADGTYRPRLSQPDLTFRVPYDASAQSAPASSVIVQDPRAALPSIRLTDASGAIWRAHADLLASHWFSRDFVVEMETDRTALLRFGDGTYGERPPPKTVFQASYRVGNGLAGNVGSEKITHYFVASGGVTLSRGSQDSIRSLRNPLPAQGGIEPEPIGQVRLNAPRAFQVQERCVTEADFAAVAERFPGVRQAQASRQWTGSWPTVFLAVEREQNRPVDEQFQDDLGQFMAPYLLVGTDLSIVPPNYVSLAITLRVHVAMGAYPDVVKQALLDTFSNGPLRDGQAGFFDPRGFRFGQPVYLSQVVARACATPGVAWVEVEQFGRWHDPSRQGLIDGEIEIGPTEIAQLENNPNAPELGQISFQMVSGDMVSADSAGSSIPGASPSGTARR